MSAKTALPITLLPLLLVASAFAPKPNPDDLLNGRELFGIDAAHSELSFRIGFLGINNVRGTFADYSAAILYDDNDVTRTSLTLIIDVASIATQNDWREKDLRSERFFDAEAALDIDPAIASAMEVLRFLDTGAG